MKYSIEKSFGVCVAGTVGAVVALAAACSPGSTEVVGSPVNCGAGTTLVGSVCVAEQPDATALSPDAGAILDGAISDGIAPDADALPSEAGDEGGDAAPLVEDPCPSGAINVNCDDTCDAGSMLDGGVPGNAAACLLIGCLNFNGPDDPRIATFTLPATFRTPEMPMSVCQGGQCSITPSTEPMLFAMIFRVQPTTPGDWVQVQVGEPWTIDYINRDEPICAYAYTNPQGIRAQDCLSEDVVGEGVFMVWTNDPNAVARNVEVTEVSSSSACH